MNGLRGLRNRISSLVYGRGLCFGMVVGALEGYFHDEESVGLPPSPDLLERLKRLHISQFRPSVVTEMARLWVRSRGGKGLASPEEIRFPDRSEPTCDPHILCFGPALSGLDRLFENFRGSHAVVPYRAERRADGTRFYVYDPNYPGHRGRYVTFGPGGDFTYGGFSAKGGWGVFPLPFCAVSRLGRCGRG